ncbi:hypothetical protein PYCC9005_002970 [Savitreella phatthalungensis]
MLLTLLCIAGVAIAGSSTHASLDGLSYNAGSVSCPVTSTETVTLNKGVFDHEQSSSLADITLPLSCSAPAGFESGTYTTIVLPDLSTAAELAVRAWILPPNGYICYDTAAFNPGTKWYPCQA